MRRLHRLIEFWNRLPVFRVVAETEHLPTAAKRLGLTAPALSRSIRLLEESVGHPLFDRQGRRIVLNPAGQVFLSVVRASMRQIDEALNAIEQVGMTGPVVVSSTGMFTPLAVAALSSVSRAHPGLEPTLTHMRDPSVNDALLQGQLDLALLQHPEAHGELCIEALAPCSYGVYAGRGHPLFEATTLELADLLAYPFVAPPAVGFGLPADGWPAHLERSVGMRITTVHSAVLFCAAGQLLSVLPTTVVETEPWLRLLRRLPIDLIEPGTLHAVYREHVGEPGSSPAEIVLAAVKAALVPCGFAPPVE